MLAGCTLRSETFRYKLTLSLNTPDGVKTGSVVNEVTESEVYGFPQGKGYPYHQRGQALFVDLGKGRKPLIALLREPCRPGEASYCSSRSHQQMDFGYYAGDGPFGIFLSHDNETHSDPERQFDAIVRWRNQHAHVDLGLEELPELITFEDVNDPLSVRSVDPSRLEDAFGPGVSWNSRTVDVVDVSTPVVFDLETKLPWYRAMRALGHDVGLDGNPNGQRDPATGKWTITNTIRMTDFEHGRN